MQIKLAADRRRGVTCGAE